jgi:hypothetical protein
MPPDVLDEIFTRGALRSPCCGPSDDGAEIFDKLARGRVVALQDFCEEGDVFGDVSIPIRHLHRRISQAFAA